MHSRIGCISTIFPQSGFSNVFSNCLPVQTHSDICFRLYFNSSPQKMADPSKQSLQSSKVIFLQVVSLSSSLLGDIVTAVECVDEGLGSDTTQDAAALPCRP